MPWLAPPGMRSFGHAGITHTAVEVEPGIFIFDIPGPISPADQEAMIAHGLTPAPLSTPPSFSPPSPTLSPADVGAPPLAHEPAPPAEVREPLPPSGWAEDDIDTMPEDRLRKVADIIDIKVDGRWSEARLRMNLAAALKERGLLIPAGE